MAVYVVSAPRSGMNWLRYCVEHFYGVRTSGKTSLIPRDVEPTQAFYRSHDALNVSRRKGYAPGAWQKIDPNATTQDTIVLILRDPLETYARMAKKSLRRFRCYAGNIQFYMQAEAKKKAVFYYADLIRSPQEMLRLMEFMDLTPAAGHHAPTLEEVSAAWDELGQKSRGQYNVNQAAGGGSQTIDRPMDFKFHQRGLSDWHKARAWRSLRDTLSRKEMELLAPFDRPADIPQAGLLDRLTDLY